MKGSLLQRELSADRLTEGLFFVKIVVTIPPTFSCENATSLYTREAYGETRLRVASIDCMADRPI